METAPRRRIPSGQEMAARSFLRDFGRFGTDDVDRFLENADKHARKAGLYVKFSETIHNRILHLRLKLGPYDPEDESGEYKTILAVLRMTKALGGNGGSAIVPSGDYFAVWQPVGRIPDYAVRLDSAIMSMETGDIAAMLKNVRIMMENQDAERRREARYDLQQACRGRLSYLDLAGGKRLDLY